MGLRSHAIESRLEGLELDDRRLMFDSRLRAFRADSNTPPEVEKKLDPGNSVDQVISLLEDLSRRIDGLKKKDRLLAEGIRLRAFQDRRQRTMYLAGCLAASGLVAAVWALRWF